MKKFLLVITTAVLTAACASSDKRSDVTTVQADGTQVAYQKSSSSNATNSKNAKYQIVDQEFDNLLAPGTDYDSLSEYELQACGATYLPPQQELKTVQPKTQVVVVKEDDLKTDTNRKKKVTNTVNIYEMDGTAPKKVSSTSTTTVTSSSSSTSSSSGSTYNSGASTSTTTF